MIKCAYDGCHNEAEFVDNLDDEVCSECMEREIKEGSSEPEDFESI